MYFKIPEKVKTKVEKSHQDPMRGFQVTISSPGETTHGNLPKTLAEQLVNKGANRWKSTTEKENPSFQAGFTAMTCWLQLSARFNAHILKNS